MLDLSDPSEILMVVGFTAVESVFLVILILAFQLPPTEPGSSVRQVGFIPRFGLVAGGTICFGVVLTLTAILALPGGALLSVVGWWVAALKLFGLTVRQTIKANIALGMLNIAMLVAIGAVLNKR